LKKKLNNAREYAADPIALSQYGHSLYCLQFDDAKLIAGDREGFLHVWDFSAPPSTVKNEALCHIQ